MIVDVFSLPFLVRCLLRLFLLRLLLMVMLFMLLLLLLMLLMLFVMLLLLLSTPQHVHPIHATVHHSLR